MEYLLMFIAAVFVNNIVLSQFLGICPFLGVSKKVSTALGMAGAVAFVLVLATIVTYLANACILVPFGLEYLRTITFILIIAALVQMVEIVLKKVSPALYQALGVFHLGDSERLQPARERCLRLLERHRLRLCAGSVCRPARTD